GGNRKSAIITYRNLVVVFLLCGLWHGPSWNFVVWGLLHGLFLIFERAGGLSIINKLWRPIRHFYTLGFFFISLVIFRQENLFRGFDYIKVLFHAKTVTPKFYYLESLVTVQIIYTLVFAVILSTPVIPWLRRRIIAGDMTGKKAMTIAYLLTQDTLLFILFFLSVITVVSTTFKPFIYFRF
ncbi:MAG: MBOAT family protein, partial [Candidatus Omnitrophica bacterium]|nr:MBOAT family protein [Candidatus Omnitrophota bacterium]